MSQSSGIRRPSHARTLLEVIRERHSARVPFEPERPIPQPHLARILEAARVAPTAHNMQNFELIVVDHRPLLAALGAIEQQVSPAFITENRALVSHTTAELQARKVGILSHNFPASWLTPGHTVPPHERSRKLGLWVESSSALLVLLFDPSRRAPGSEGDFLGIMSLGCVLENMWLEAASLGLGFQVLSAFGDNDAGTQARALLGIPERLRVALAVRLGYPAEAEEHIHIRRDLESFVHHNHYGVGATFLPDL